MAEPRPVFTSGVRAATTAGRPRAGSLRSVASAMPDPVDTRCQYNDPKKGWCRAYRARDTEYCIGHLRARGEA